MGSYNRHGVQRVLDCHKGAAPGRGGRCRGDVPPGATRILREACCCLSSKLLLLLLLLLTLLLLLPLPLLLLPLLPLLPLLLLLLLLLLLVLLRHRCWC